MDEKRTPGSALKMHGGIALVVKAIEAVVVLEQEEKQANLRAGAVIMALPLTRCGGGMSTAPENIPSGGSCLLLFCLENETQ